MRSYLFWSLGNLLVGVYIGVVIFFTVGRWDMDCVRDELRWLSVYLVLHLAHFLRKLLLAYYWAKSEDPSLCQIKVNLLCVLLLFIPEISWYIYGNTIVYDDNFL